MRWFGDHRLGLCAGSRWCGPEWLLGRPKSPGSPAYTIRAPSPEERDEQLQDNRSDRQPAVPVVAAQLLASERTTPAPGFICDIKGDVSRSGRR